MHMRSLTLPMGVVPALLGALCGCGTPIPRGPAAGPAQDSTPPSSASVDFTPLGQKETQLLKSLAEETAPP